MVRRSMRSSNRPKFRATTENFFKLLFDMDSTHDGSDGEEGSRTISVEPHLTRSHGADPEPLRARPIVNTCRLQDVVLLSCPLTELYGTPEPVPESDDENDVDSQNIKKGTEPIPEEIQDLCKQIRSFKTNKSNLRMRMELKRNLPQHFNARSRTLKKTSSLLRHFGDTRLFSKEEWNHLRGDGSGGSPSCR